MEKIETKFIRYMNIDTKSNDESLTSPSTDIQFNLANLLVEELHSLGVSNAYVNEYGLVYAKIDGDSSLPKIGLIAHMDTAPDLIGGNYTPRIISNYDGTDIKLNEEYTMKVIDFPHLYNLKGRNLIVTDGNHLLGGDDKAGVAIIMSIVEYYMTHKDIKHAPIRVCFTVDEEIGRGPDHFDVKEMDADFAYTLDGEDSDEINFENFNASSVKVEIDGVGIHPGNAKDKMINSALVAMEFNSMLDPNMVPSKTEGYEGFNHLCDITGNVENTKMEYILRNHDTSLLKSQEEKFLKIKDELSRKYPKASIKVTIKQSYKNMADYFKTDKTALLAIEKAYKATNNEFRYAPIRGGTDGATITYMGLACPNIGTGTRCPHGRYEHVVIDEMYEMFEIVKALLEQR